MARRRYTLLIDCESSGFRKGVRFWSEALGAPARHSGDPTDPFIELPGATGDLHVEMQRINGPGRYHLDLFAPDVDAEARRLEDLGAEKVSRGETWWVMRAPTGHLFCIIPDSVPEPDDFDDEDDEVDDDDDEVDEVDEVDDDDDRDALDEEDGDDDFDEDDDDDDDDYDDDDDEDEEEDEEPAKPEPPRKYPPLRSVPNN